MGAGRPARPDAEDISRIQGIDAGVLIERPCVASNALYMERTRNPPPALYQTLRTPEFEGDRMDPFSDEDYRRLQHGPSVSDHALRIWREHRAPPSNEPSILN